MMILTFHCKNVSMNTVPSWCPGVAADLCELQTLRIVVLALYTG